MDESAAVACEVCGYYEVTVYAWAVSSARLIDQQLPLGWRVREEADERTGKRRVVVYCPNHRPEEQGRCTMRAPCFCGWETRWRYGAPWGRASHAHWHLEWHMGPEFMLPDGTYGIVDRGPWGHYCVARQHALTARPRQGRQSHAVERAR